MAMPPQGAPSDAQQSPDAGPPNGGQPSGGVGKLIDSIHSGLSDLMQIFSKTQGIPDQFKQRLDELGQGFTGLIQEMSQSEGEAEQAPQEATSPATMEAGANKNVQPAM